MSKSAEQTMLDRLNDSTADEGSLTSIRISPGAARRLDAFRRKKTGKNGRSHLESRGEVAELLILSALERLEKEKAARKVLEAKLPGGAGTVGSMD